MESTYKQGPDTIEAGPIQPLEVVDNFDYSHAHERYNLPFTSKDEARGFLRGSEHEVLATKGQPLFSYDFVQCAGALIRNRETGLIFSLHESTWSDATDVVLAIQKPNNLDVITMEGAMGTMLISDIVAVRNQPISRIEYMFEQVGGNDNVQRFRKSWIRGLTGVEINKMRKMSEKNPNVGVITHLGVINLKNFGAGQGRWSMLYRPKENVVRIYDDESKKLFKFPGFDIKK